MVNIKEKITGFTTGSEPITNQTNYMVLTMMGATVTAATAYLTGNGSLEALLVFFSLFAISVVIRGMAYGLNLEHDRQKLTLQLRKDMHEIEVIKANAYSNRPDNEESEESVLETGDTDRGSGSRGKPRDGDDGSPKRDSTGIIHGHYSRGTEPRPIEAPPHDGIDDRPSFT